MLLSVCMSQQALLGFCRHLSPTTLSLPQESVPLGAAFADEVEVTALGTRPFCLVLHNDRLS